jgi:hypothetical protein
MVLATMKMPPTICGVSIRTLPVRNVELPARVQRQAGGIDRNERIAALAPRYRKAQGCRRWRV